MDIKEVIENAGEALSDSVEKVTTSISPGLANIAETQLAKQVAAIVSTAGEKAEEALSKAGDALEKSHVKETAQSVSLPAPATDLVDKTKEAVHSSDHGGARKAV